MTRLLLLLVLLVVCLGAAAGCGSAGGGRGGATPSASGTPSATITMRGLAFHPRTVTVKVGDRVTWVNRDSVEHNVTATRGARFHSRAFSAGAAFSFRPGRPGTIRYVCTLHPGMTGTLIVR